jgi:hypothetical protein
MDRLVRFLPWSDGPAAQAGSRPLRNGTLMVAAVVLASACAHKLPEPAGSQAEPHVSWAIGVGASDGDEVHVCQSSPRSVCELEASTASQPIRSSIHLHLHAGDSGAMFVGEMRATFLAGTAGASTKINNVVLTKREASAGLTGVVVDRPGRYEFSYSVVASGVGGARTIEDRVEVIIR